MIKIVIIDDEPKAIDSLKWEIQNFCSEVEIVESFTDPRKALQYFESKPEIDCLFLDIEMPQMDGFRFLEELEHRDFAVIITTAYDQYGINAIKERALDYLLKPIDSDDLIEACKRVKEFKKENNIVDLFEERLLKIMGGTDSSAKRIGINVDGKILFLKPDEITYCEGDGNYTSIFLEDGGKIFLTQTLKKVEEKLTSGEFFRVHNSYVVNLTKVREYLKNDAYLIMIDGKHIPVSRHRKTDFLGKF